MKISRRNLFKLAGGATAVCAFMPRIAFAAPGKLKSFRSGLQPNGDTRLVIETTTKPSYKISYPDNQIAISFANTTTNKAIKPTLAKKTLVNDLVQYQSGDRLFVTAKLSTNVSKISDNKIFILEPNGDTDYRLVLDFNKASSSAAKTTTAATTTKKQYTIVIDAGHGGKDPGCVGKRGTYEKTVVLSVAKKLKTKLDSLGFKTYLTRSTDKFLNLSTRSSLAEKYHADLFLSLHANANPSRSMKGFSVYTLSQKASDEEARKLAEAENASDKIDVDGFEKFPSDIRNTLSSLQQQAVAEMSIDYAEDCVASFKSSSIKQQSGPTVRYAPFAVLRSTVPAALIELGHLSNADEEKLLRSSTYQNKLATTIANSVKAYDFNA